MVIRVFETPLEIGVAVGGVRNEEAYFGVQAYRELVQNVGRGLVQEGRELCLVRGVEEVQAEAIIGVHDAHGGAIFGEGYAVERDVSLYILRVRRDG